MLQLAPGEAGLRAYHAAARIDPDTLHGPHVQDDATIDHAIAGDIVPASTYRQGQAALTREPEGRHHIRDARAAGDERGPPVDSRVPDLPQLVIARITREDEIAAKTFLQLVARRRAGHSGRVF
jgi:hypothetical protein